MAVEGSAGDLVQVVALLGAAWSRCRCSGARARLGARLSGAAASRSAPSASGCSRIPQAILHVAELGVVMFLFIIGLEMQPSRLWSLRREIFGLGRCRWSSAARC